MPASYRLTLSVLAVLVGLQVHVTAAEDCKGSCAAWRKQCDRAIAALVAGVRGTTIASETDSEEELKEGWQALHHPNATAFSVYCGQDGIAVNAEWKDAFPPAAFFDLIDQAGSIVTRRPLSVIQSAAARCHEQALVDEDHIIETEIDGVDYQCKAGEKWKGTSITILKPRA